MYTVISQHWASPDKVMFYQRQGVIVSYKAKDILDKIKACTTKISSGKVYFDKGSTFPRVKLDTNKFKRILKKENADIVIIKSLGSYHDMYSNCTIFKDPETGEQFYCTNSDTSSIQEVFKAQYGYNLEIVYVGSCSYIHLQADANVINAVMTGEYSKVMLDSDLEKECSGILSEFDMDALISIQDMLKSKDNSIRNMGILAVTGYNIQEYLDVIRVLFAIQNVVLTGPQPVLVEQLKRTLNYHMPYYLRSFLGQNYSECNEKTKEMLRYLLFPLYQSFVSSTIDYYVQAANTSGLGIKVTYNVE